MKKFVSLVLLLAFLYRDSFFSRFFQDDKILFDIVKNKLPFIPIPNFPYRPIAIDLFYGSGLHLFGLEPFWYHLILFLFFAGALYFLYKITNFPTVFFYALNISLFPLFYWIATSYFSIGAFFFFGAIYYFKNNKNLLCFIFYLLAILTNEASFVLPLIFVLFNFKRAILFNLLNFILFAVRIVAVGFHSGEAYKLDFSLQFFKTLQWYVLRALNLPEGIRNNLPIVLIFVLFVFLVLLNFRHLNFKLICFSAVWFLAGALPFYFLPNHMSAYYLTFAMPGAAYFLGHTLKGKALIFGGALYLILSFWGLEFLRQTHWIILKNTGPIGQF